MAPRKTAKRRKILTDDLPNHETPWRPIPNQPDGFFERVAYWRVKKGVDDFRHKVEIQFNGKQYREKGDLETVLARRPDCQSLLGVKWFDLARYNANSKDLQLLAEGAARAGDESPNTLPAASGGLQCPPCEMPDVPGVVQPSSPRREPAALPALPPLHGPTANGDYIRCKLDYWKINNYFPLLRRVDTLPTTEGPTSAVNASCSQMATVSPPLVSAAPPNCTPPYYMKMEELWVIMASLPDIAAVTVCGDQVKEFTRLLDAEALPVVDNWQRKGTPEKPFVCPGNVVFACPQGSHKKPNKCSDSPLYWKKMYDALTKNSYHQLNDRPVISKFTARFKWKVSAFAGALEVIASESVVYKKSYAKTDGPTCVFCERRVCALEKATPPICKSCSQARITTDYHPHGQEEINAVYEALTAGVEPRESCNQTLVFLTARKSGKSDVLDMGVFQAVWRSVELSENNPGVFGKTNRPGFPMPMKLVGRFASAANACSPVYRMTRKTVNQPDDIPPLSMLSDFIVASYRPGDVVLIAMSHPTNFAIVHHDVAAFIYELFARGISESALYFYYFGLVISPARFTRKYETVVSASELRRAILEGMPRYGLRPRVSAVLFSMERGVIERQHMSKRGRNTLEPVDRQTASQFALVNAENRLANVTLCDLRQCKRQLGKSFSVQCRQCPRWYHGECVQLTVETANSINQQMLEWICRRCHLELLVESNMFQEAVELAVKHDDFSHYVFICHTGHLLGDWKNLSKYSIAFAHLDKDFYGQALFATAKCNDYLAFASLLLQSHQMTGDDVDGLVKAFTDEQDIDGALIQLLANTRKDDELYCPTPPWGTPNNSPVLGDRRDFAYGQRLSVTSLSDKDAAPSLSALAYVSPSRRTPPTSPLVRHNPCIPRSPLLALALANSQTERIQQSDVALRGATGSPLGNHSSPGVLWATDSSPLSVSSGGSRGHGDVSSSPDQQRQPRIALAVAPTPRFDPCPSLRLPLASPSLDGSGIALHKSPVSLAASLGSGAISTAPPLITHGLAPRKQPFKAPRKLTLRKPPLKGTSQCNTSLSCDAGAVAETTLPVVTGLTAPTVSAGLGNSVLRATTATVSRTARLPLAARGTKGSGVNQPFKPVVVSKRNGR